MYEHTRNQRSEVPGHFENDFRGRNVIKKSNVGTFSNFREKAQVELSRESPSASHKKLLTYFNAIEGTPQNSNDVEPIS